ncbi:hypothetical protein [Goodfellowiella coeruleoviolacea]|uniref:Uncharacterized protein n=1 Tax=Goodfellowiella coeruleoviolacea TaxID=334858 RepID=A0AAE3GFE4_9PSEU|nr:hypothetical protein [Goodfellowiella coeruleoviolacea]MCP2167246.1 hypothetical protein [Goodfellowiella coeruleoviolacea]
MPETYYGAHETATLIVLALENRDVPNPELTNRYGIELRPTGRTKLNRAGLIRTRTESRPYVHRITDAGRQWCERNLVSLEAPPRSGPLPRAVFELLRLLIPNLQRRGISPVELIRSGGLETLIREAYRDLSVKPQDWVRLAKLRPKLNGVGKDEVDEVLLQMVRTGTTHLAPDSNRKVLTDADHAAAVRIGGEDKHLMAIEES